MKYLITLLLITLIVPHSFSQEKVDIKTTTYYFIRHAEKNRSDASNKNPHLNDLGKARAENWNTIFKHIKFDAIYSTDYNRTKETAEPTATKNNIVLTLYHPFKIDLNTFLKNTKGKTILVVGHSNTTPDFVNKILGTKKHEHIDDGNNSNLYTITITGDAILAQVLVID